MLMSKMFSQYVLIKRDVNVKINVLAILIEIILQSHKYDISLVSKDNFAIIIVCSLSVQYQIDLNTASVIF